MVPYLGCDAARELLEPLVDGELPMPDQVGLEAHLRWCETCRIRVEDLRLIGASLRRGGGVVVRTRDERALASVQSEVLARISAERDQSWPVKVREACADRRLLWPALGATAAVVLCVYAATIVNRVARLELPSSLAEQIAVLASPGSDRYPLPLDARILPPKPIDQGLSLQTIPSEDVVFALAAVVTRDGRVANFELLDAADSAHVSALLDAVKGSRFAPARTSDGAVAVNVVWVVASTTVKGELDPNDTGVIVPLAAPAPGADVVAKPLSGRLGRPALRPARS
jgi:hypothetical protein